MTKHNLSDSERSKIRWSSTKRGYICRLEFAPIWSRRGPRPIRPIRSEAFTTRTQAEKHAAYMLDQLRFAGNMLCLPEGLEIIEVDAMGREQGREAFGFDKAENREFLYLLNEERNEAMRGIRERVQGGRILGGGGSWTGARL